MHPPEWSKQSVSHRCCSLHVDGACQPCQGEGGNWVTSVGAILIDSSGRGLRFFGMHLPAMVTDEWGRCGRQQLVFEAEVLPYLLALECWHDIMAGRHVLIFIDNDGARHSWIRGGAESIHAMPCRTASNVADGPSRLDFRLCRALGAVETKVPVDTLRKCAIGGCVANVYMG